MMNTAFAALTLICAPAVPPATNAKDRMTPSRPPRSRSFCRPARRARALRSLLRSPGLTFRAKEMGDYLRSQSALPPRLSGFASILTACTCHKT